jgi:hypothetical protein
VRDEGRCALNAVVSMSVRVALAARAEGLDLGGVTFLGSGEPATAAKVREITRGGARWVPSYWMQEAGALGFGCARPEHGEDLHFLADTAALIQHPRCVPGTDATVPAFLLTSLRPTAAKVLLNVESDDYGVVEARACGCPLETVGYRKHIREVRSFRKLTGEGVTLVGSEMLTILEEVLPARFGGSPLDYQLAEEEDGRGFTRLVLRVSPSVGPLDEGQVIQAVLAALERGGGAARMARAMWHQAGSLRVRRERPVATARGKLMPLHLARRAQVSGGAAPDS